MTTTILWLGRDLRVSDHPALLAAREGGSRVLPLFVADPALRKPSGAPRQALVRTGTPYAIGPGSLVKGSGTPYQVFTPFRTAWLRHGWPAPAPAPADPRWARGIDGEAAARERWEGRTGYPFVDAGMRQLRADTAAAGAAR